jgi:hypothetical protein
MSERDPLSKLLDELPQLEPSALLRRRVFEIPARHPRTQVPKWFGLFRGPRAAALALGLLALGVWSGWATSADEDVVQAPELEQEAQQWEELSELALATELSEDFR